MASRFPCPRCKFTGFTEGELEGKVWRVFKRAGVGECMDCGLMLEADLIREKLNRNPDPFVCFHSFAQTGMKRSWCSICGAVGEYDFYEGKYKEIHP